MSLSCCKGSQYTSCLVISLARNEVLAFKLQKSFVRQNSLLLLFLESQAPSDMNRSYTDQLCDMECKATAKLTDLPKCKCLAPRLATRFS